MNKLALICLLFIIPAALCDDCSNPLLGALKITGISTAATQNGLAYCKGLEGKSICCTPATINTLQNTVNTMVANMIVKAAARDQNLLTLRTSTGDDGVSSLKTKYATLQSNAKSAYNAVDSALTAENAKTSGKDQTKIDQLTALKTALVPYTTISDDLATTLTTTASQWSTYQKNRATCIDDLVEAQASIACLACRPDYATQGVSGTSSAPAVSFLSAFNTAISGSCQPFFASAQVQNKLVIAYALKSKLDSLASLMSTITTTPTGTTAAQLATAATPDTITDDAKEPVVLGTCASSSDCAFVYTTVLAQGAVLNQAYAANGGQITVSSSSSSSRLLADSRTLASGNYDPSASANSAGVAVAFPEDAIAALNSGWRQGGLMTCVVALVAMLLL